MKRFFKFLTTTFVLLTICITAAYGQARLTFSGGNGTPLTVTLENTVTYTLTSNCASGPFFIFQNVGRIFLFSPDYPNPPYADPAFPTATGNITYSINGGTAQPINQEVNSFAINSVSKTDFGFYGSSQPGAPAGSTIVLFPGTVTTTTKVSGTPPAGTNTYPTFITNSTGVKCDAAVTGLNPTAASVSVSGRVVTNDNRGLSNAVVYLTNSQGIKRSARTSSFGYYSFEDVQAGQTVILTVVSKRYQFAPQVLNLNEEITELNFAPEP